MKRSIEACAALALWCGGAAEAAIIDFAAPLSGAAENPPVSTMGSGSVLVSFDTLARTLTVDLDFADLTGLSTVAHIHCCVDQPGNAGVATYPVSFPGFPQNVQSGSYSGSWDLTQDASFTASFLTGFGGGTATGAADALLAGLYAGRAYVNVHSSFAGGGEIRGFLAAVPTPGTGSLLGGGFLLAVWAGRRAARRD
jgi:hypothetical protein